MARKKSLRKTLDDLIDAFIPEIRDAFQVAIQGIVDNVLLKDLIEAIENGDPERAFRLLGFSDAAMRPLTATIERAFETGGIAVGGTFPNRINTTNGRAVFRFDVRNSRAERILRDSSSTLVTRIMEDTRANLRNALFEGVRRGVNPRTTALDIVGRVGQNGARQGGLVGLTPGQQGWVDRARMELESLDANYLTRKLRDRRFDSIVRRAIAEKKPLTADQISRLTTAYKSRALKYRGDVIARTESVAALNRSAHEAIQQAIDMGAAKQSAVKRVWDSAGNDGRTRDTHLEMDGQTVGMDEPFTFPDGSVAMFPGDASLGAPAEEIIQCRCRVRLEIDWLADVD